MRRAQSVRHYTTRSAAPSAATGTDDLGMLKEVPEESTEVTLRRQLLEKEKESDKVRGSLNFSPQRMRITALLPLFAAPGSDSGFAGAARPSATNRGYPRTTKGIQQP